LKQSDSDITETLIKKYTQETFIFANSMPVVFRIKAKCGGTSPFSHDPSISLS
jgi:hypothetical protein